MDTYAIAVLLIHITDQTRQVNAPTDARIALHTRVHAYISSARIHLPLHMHAHIFAHIHICNHTSDTHAHTHMYPFKYACIWIFGNSAWSRPCGRIGNDMPCNNLPPPSQHGNDGWPGRQGTQQLINNSVLTRVWASWACLAAAVQAATGV